MAKPVNLFFTFPRVFCGLASLLTIWAFWSGGQDPDVLFPISSYIPILAALFAILVFTESLGTIALSYLPKVDGENSFVLRATLGVFIAASGMGLLGLFGGLGGYTAIFVNIFFVLCSVFADRRRPLQINIPSIKSVKTQLSVDVVVQVFIFTLFGFFALFPIGHPDPLYYHLRAPSLWYLEGKIHFDQGAPLLFLTGLWEYFYLFAMHILPIKRGFGLIEQQILCQLLHLCFGAFFSFVLLRKLAERIFSITSRNFLICVLMLFFCLPFNETMTLAKNDWGAMTFALACFYTLHTFFNSKALSSLFLAALFGGATLVTKPSYFVMTFLFSVSLILIHRKMLPRQLFKAGFISVIGGGIGVAAVFLRNLTLVGTPLFPFGNYELLSPTDQLFFSSIVSWPGKLPLSEYTNFALDLFWLLPIIPLALIHLDLRRRKEFLLLLPVLVSFFYFWQFYMPAINWRLLGVFFPIVIFLSFLAVQSLTARFHSKFPLVIFTAFAIATLFTSKSIDTYRYRLSILGNPSLMIRDHQAGDSMAWLRMQTKEPKGVYFGGNNQLYYLFNIDAKTVESNFGVDNIMFPLETGEERIQALADMGAQYFVETYAPVHMRITALLLNPIMNKCRECIVFAGKRSRVASIPELLTYISQDDYEPIEDSNRGLILLKQK